MAAVWMLLVDNESLPELLVGAGVAVIATIGHELVRAQRGATYKLRWIWLTRLWKPIARIPVDVGVVMWTLVLQVTGRRKQPGQLRALRFHAASTGADSNGRRALAEAAGSTAPNTVIIGIDTRRNLILAHQLRPTDSVPAALDPLELG